MSNLQQAARRSRSVGRAGVVPRVRRMRYQVHTHLGQGSKETPLGAWHEPEGRWQETEGPRDDFDPRDVQHRAGRQWRALRSAVHVPRPRRAAVRRTHAH